MSGHVVVAGGSGFIGRELAKLLREEGIPSVQLSRRPDPQTSYDLSISWNGRDLGAWTAQLEGAVGIVNLAGSPIAARWTPAARAQILSSRIQPTTAIAQALARATNGPKVWVNASAVGVYGESGFRILSEDDCASRPQNFMVQTCVAWERACLNAPLPSVRRVVLRMGTVLGHGGMLEQVRPFVAAFLGGAAGSGGQWLSWIHVHDVAKMVVWALGGSIEGPVNAVSPNPVTNAQFMETLRHAMHRPWSPPVPAIALRMYCRFTEKQADPLLMSQRVQPHAALKAGFQFDFPMLEPALRQVMGSWGENRS